MSADPEPNCFRKRLGRGRHYRARQDRRTTDFKIESTAAKAKLADPATIVSRKQRRPCIESGGVATTDTVTARITAVIIAGRVAPTCVRIIVAIVVIVVPRRGGGGDYSRQQSIPG